MENEQARIFLKEVFSEYEQKRNEHKIDYENLNLFKNIIRVYLTYVEKPEFHILVENYKEKYIFNESQVEQNISLEEQLGIGEMYDYIKNFDFHKDHFNLFTTSLILHSKLYSHCEYPGFGGKLRDTTVYLFDTNYEVVDPIIAQKYFNNLIPISDSIFEPLNDKSKMEDGYFCYIEKCIIQITDLIKMQPFADGNKRTFRALLNLLLKKIKIPPIYIEQSENEIYKNALLAAIKNNDYSQIIHFYYYKICNAIMTLDINHSILKDEDENLKK